MVPDGSSNAKGTTAVRIQCCVRSVASLGIDLQNNLLDKPSAERERERERWTRRPLPVQLVEGACLPRGSWPH